MPRDVTHHAAAPIKIDPALAPGATPPAPNVVPWPRDDQGNLKPVFVCACGLSAKFPFCDGSHKACRDETPGVVYRYENGERRGV